VPYRPTERTEAKRAATREPVLSAAERLAFRHAHVAPRADPDALVADLVAFCLRSVTDWEIAHAG
jgi:hypothetical protein